MPRDSALVHQVDNSRFAYRGDGVRAESHATAHTTEEPNQSQRAKVKIFPALTARSKVWGLVLSTLKYLRDRKKISRYLKIFPYLFAVWSDLINGNVVFFSVGRYFSRFFCVFCVKPLQSSSGRKGKATNTPGGGRFRPSGRV